MRRGSPTRSVGGSSRWIRADGGGAAAHPGRHRARPDHDRQPPPGPGPARCRWQSPTRPAAAAGQPCGRAAPRNLYGAGDKMRPRRESRPGAARDRPGSRARQPVGAGHAVMEVGEAAQGIGMRSAPVADVLVVSQLAMGADDQEHYLAQRVDDPPGLALIVHPSDNAGPGGAEPDSPAGRPDQSAARQHRTGSQGTIVALVNQDPRYLGLCPGSSPASWGCALTRPGRDAAPLVSPRTWMASAFAALASLQSPGADACPSQPGASAGDPGVGLHSPAAAPLLLVSRC